MLGEKAIDFRDGYAAGLEREARRLLGISKGEDVVLVGLVVHPRFAEQPGGPVIIVAGLRGILAPDRKARRISRRARQGHQPLIEAGSPARVVPGLDKMRLP